MNKKKIIIDCDPGIDDALAIMLACQSPELDILGLTIVSGNINGEQCAENALNILDVMGRTDIPVYLGKTTPLKRKMVLAKETHGEDGLGGYPFKRKNKITFKNGGVAFLAKTLMEEEDVSILPIGPLTNIATLIQDYPEAAKKIKEIVLMGGTFKSHGNTSPVAEFNFWADPDAAAVVFKELDCPITMVGLDVTREVVLTPNYIEMLHQFDEPLADVIVGITRFYTDFHWKQERTLGCVINDPLAIAYFINRDLCKGKDYYVDIITGGKAIGMSMVDEANFFEKKPNCKVLTQVDAASFMEMLLTRLFKEHADDIHHVLYHPKYGYQNEY